MSKKEKKARNSKIKRISEKYETEITFNQLQKIKFDPLQFAVEGLLPAGLLIFAGSPKVGKSLFVLDLCLSVAQGLPFLDRETNKGDVIYFAFEDTYRSLQERMRKQGFDGAIDGNVIIRPKPIGLRAGFIDLVDFMVSKKPKTNLICIDVFEHIRDNEEKSQLLYKTDMADMSILRQITAKYPHLTILLVHHNTKLIDPNNVVNQVSGSTGLIGGSDGVLVLHKRKVTDQEATLTCIMREIKSTEIALKLDETTLKWQNVPQENEKNEGQNGKKHNISSQSSEKTVAEILLLHLLADDKVMSKQDIIEKAKVLDITDDKLRYAREKLNIKVLSNGKKGTFWQL